MKKLISLLMAVILFLMPASAMADAVEDSPIAELEAILEIEPENMTYSQYFMFEHGFHSDEASADTVLLSRRTGSGDLLLADRGGTVYAGDEEVSGYVGNAELVFYMAGNTIYRYHVKSRQTDAVYQGTGIITWYPITSKVLLIGKNNGTVASTLTSTICTDELDRENLAYYEVDTDEQRIVSAEDPERDIFLTQGDGYINLSSYTCTINGRTIPKSDYPINSVYNSSFDGGSQCAGFALYIYYFLWGSTDYGQTYDCADMTGSTWQSMKSYLNTKSAGARVRVSDSSSSQDPGHSFVICKAYTNYIIVYHSNWAPGVNYVRVTHFTYEQLHSYYSYVHMVKNP